MFRWMSGKAKEHIQRLKAEITSCLAHSPKTESHSVVHARDCSWCSHYQMRNLFLGIRIKLAGTKTIAVVIIVLNFLQIVGEMSPEQRKVLLFFWTSVKYLPVEGFHGLASRLYIYRTTESHDRLPSSHTCFFRLCFPPYPSIDVMQERLSIITQEHVGCSFGTWWNRHLHIRDGKGFWTCT